MKQLTRKPDRQNHNVDDLYSFLDGQWWGVLAVPTSGPDRSAPITVPTLYVRDDDRLLVHGSTGAGALGVTTPDADVAFSVTAMDALVLAPTMFDSTVHYRSAVVHGRLHPAAAADRERLLARFMELIVPGRLTEVPAMTRKEIAATNVSVLPIESGSWIYKTNSRDDLPLPAEDVTTWSGIIPFTSGYAEPKAASWAADQPVPASVHRLLGSRTDR